MDSREIPGRWEHSASLLSILGLAVAHAAPKAPEIMFSELQGGWCFMERREPEKEDKAPLACCLKSA